LLWEEFFYKATEDVINSELGACSHLQDLQGEGIPGTLQGILQLIHPLVLEYIPGESLTTTNPSSVPRSLTCSLITTVCSFASHGVIHCDLRADNIIFSSNNPLAGSAHIVACLLFSTVMGKAEEDERLWYMLPSKSV
jgi:serine/threonine protein kinase